MGTDGLDSILLFLFTDSRSHAYREVRLREDFLYARKPGRCLQINRYYAIFVTIIITYRKLKRQQTSTA